MTDTPNGESDADAELVRIPGGSISLKDEASNRYWTVQLRDYCLAAFPVTQALYGRIVGRSVELRAARKLPMVDVSWIEAVQFCNALSVRHGLPACYSTDDAGEVQCDWSSSGYRLPSEAEWEYACRAGSNEARYGDLDAIAWHRGNSDGALQPVGLKQSNEWGLYDMIGNVWEWCWDLYDPRVYGAYRVFRGGGWSDAGSACRASCRRKSAPTFRIDDLGFRLARSIDA